jgi:hypothetical protein
MIAAGSKFAKAVTANGLPFESAMRHLRTALLIPIFTCAVAVNQARAIEIALAGDECGSPELLGLTLVLGGPEGDTIVGCATAEFNGLPGGFGEVSDGSVGLYGEFIESVDLEFTGLLAGEAVTVSDASALPLLEELGGGVFRLFSDGEGAALQVCDDGECLGDVVLSFADVSTDRTLTVRVVAVNEVTVPEPATLAVTALGLTAALVRRRRRR